MSEEKKKSWEYRILVHDLTEEEADKLGDLLRDLFDPIDQVDYIGHNDPVAAVGVDRG